MECSRIKPSEEKRWEKYYLEDAIRFSFPKMNIYDLVYEENRNRKDLFAMEFEGKNIRYGDFFDKVEEKTEFFKGKNINSADIVTMSMLMTPEFVYDWYALSRLHAVSNLIDPRTSAEGIEEYIKEANSNLVLNTDIFSGKIRKAIQEYPINVVNYSLNDSANRLSFPLNMVSAISGLSSIIISKNDDRFERYSKIENNTNVTSTFPDYKQDTPLTIVHTGGTTGIPKGVVLSHDNYNAMAWEYLKSGIGFSKGESFLLIMPPWISYGSGMLHMSMVAGMKSIIIPKLESKKMANYIIKYKPEWFAGVPAHYQIINDNGLIKKNKVPFLNAGAVGGDAMSKELYESVNNFLLDNGAKKGVYPGYALTEATSAFAVRHTKEFKADSVGIPLPGNTVGIFKFDEDTEQTLDIELGYNQRGEICLCTPNKMLGYFKNSELTDLVLKKHLDGIEWIHTGDLGYIDEDGFLYVNGRIKEMITRYDGFKIYPNLIEKVALSCNGVSASKVVGVNDKTHLTGQVPKMFITLKEEFLDNQSQVVEEIKKRCKLCLPEYYNEGISFEVLEKLPLTALGKIDFKELQEIGNQASLTYSKNLQKVLNRK